MSINNTFYKNNQIKDILKNKNLKIHFAGICGISMSALAVAFGREGYRISGSDKNIKDSDISFFKENNITTSRDANAEEIAKCDIVCYTLAMSENSLEIVTAKEQNKLLLSRSQLLGAYMDNYKEKIGVCGTHGKSTTVSFLTEIFGSLNLHPTVFSGAKIDGDRSFILGEREHFIFESCEYRDSFLNFRPDILTVGRIELDHTDYFKSEEQYFTSFKRAVAKSKVAVISSTTQANRRFIADLKSTYIISKEFPEKHNLKKIVTVGSDENNTYRFTHIKPCEDGTSFRLYKNKDFITEVKINLIGDFNAENATLAIASASESGINILDAAKAVANFKGLDRRMEKICEINSRPVFYDYAHHPTEISETLKALKQKYGMLTVIFRPHTYTRTRDLFKNFQKALKLADFSVILDIYAAREFPIEGVTSERLAAEIGTGSIYLKQNEVLNYVINKTQGAIVLMGAGDLSKIKKEFEEY